MRDQRSELVLAWSEEKLRQILQKVVGRFHAELLFGRWIPKHVLYEQMSWWFKSTKTETRQTFEALQAQYPGVLFANRGLFVPKSYLLMNAKRDAQRLGGGQGSVTSLSSWPAKNEARPDPPPD